MDSIVAVSGDSITCTPNSTCYQGFLQSKEAFETDRQVQAIQNHNAHQEFLAYQLSTPIAACYCITVIVVAISLLVWTEIQAGFRRLELTLAVERERIAASIEIAKLEIANDDDNEEAQS